MNWQTVPLDGGLGAWCAEWDALNERLYGGHPFNDSRFVDAMLRHFGGGSERLLIRRGVAGVDAMLILYHRRSGIWSQFVPAQSQAAPPLAEDSDVLRELFSVLPRGTWAIELLCQDPDHAPRGLLVEAATNRMSIHATTINVQVADTFEQYWNARSKKLVQNMRRYQRRVEEALGVPHMKVLRDPGAMREAVVRYGRLESAGWKGEAGTAVNEANVQGRFYTEIMEQFAARGQAQAVEYWLGERLVAARLLIVAGGMIVMLKTAYDEDLSKHAPGRLLLKDYLEYAFRHKEAGSVEFYTDATPDQLAWSTGRRHIYHVMLFRSAYHARLYDLFRSLKRRGGNQPSRDGEEAVAAALEIEFRVDDAVLAGECANLLQPGATESFDLSAAWYRLLGSKAVPEGLSPEHAVIRRGDSVLGIVPLFLRRRSLWGRQGGGMSNFYTSLYRPALTPSIGPNDLALALKLLVSRERLDILRFDAMDPEHPSFSLLESALRGAGLRAYRFFCFGNWYLPVKGRSFQEYLESLPSRIRNTLRRGERKFLNGRRGHLEMVSHEGIEPAIKAWNRIYHSSWKRAEPFPDFIAGLIRLCAEQGWLRMGIAYYDGEPVAAQVWIVNGGRAAIYKLAYDKKVEKLSVGTILTAFLMAHVLDVDKVREVDYLIGDDAYKRDWMSHRRERWGIVAYNPRTLSGLIGWLVQAVGGVRRALAKDGMQRPAQPEPAASMDRDRS